VWGDSGSAAKAVRNSARISAISSSRGMMAGLYARTVGRRKAFFMGLFPSAAAEPRDGRC
jgi:hypothetical protein